MHIEGERGVVLAPVSPLPSAPNVLPFALARLADYDRQKLYHADKCLFIYTILTCGIKWCKALILLGFRVIVRRF